MRRAARAPPAYRLARAHSHRTSPARSCKLAPSVLLACDNLRSAPARNALLCLNEMVQQLTPELSDVLGARPCTLATPCHSLPHLTAPHLPSHRPRV